MPSASAGNSAEDMRILRGRALSQAKNQQAQVILVASRGSYSECCTIPHSSQVPRVATITGPENIQSEPDEPSAPTSRLACLR